MNKMLWVGVGVLGLAFLASAVWGEFSGNGSFSAFASSPSYAKVWTSVSHYSEVTLNNGFPYYGWMSGYVTGTNYTLEYVNSSLIVEETYAYARFVGTGRLKVSGSDFKVSVLGENTQIEGLGSGGAYLDGDGHCEAYKNGIGSPVKCKN